MARRGNEVVPIGQLGIEKDVGEKIEASHSVGMIGCMKIVLHYIGSALILESQPGRAIRRKETQDC